MGLLTPERFDGWYPHLTNQGAHGGLVGGGMALVTLLLLPPALAWLAVVLVYSVAWEVVAQGIGLDDDDYPAPWNWRDSLDDTANVGGGAAVLISAYAWGLWPAIAAYAAWGAALAYSVWRRM